jgi:hypothetical protein
MKLGRKYLWFLLIGALLPLALVVIEQVVGGFPIERMFFFSPFLRNYWFPIAVGTWMLMMPLAALHALTNPAVKKLWQRIVWVLLFVVTGQIAVTVYCIMCLRSSAWRAQSPA